jgi:hypothetical protein
LDQLAQEEFVKFLFLSRQVQSRLEFIPVAQPEVDRSDHPGQENH